ncbi:GMC family oxidoreductase [Pseudonocardia sp. CA-142604]|uniref:GMC family oxidoreductase n=1 Tax=Pseudonocardia sp. CA-142604 TaxID=3240024 RepID=UPI003D8FA108
MTSAVDSCEYVVVGGGTAGCVIASRLSQGDGTRVLLVEAGGEQQVAAISVPAAWPGLVQSPLSWGDFTVQQAATGTTVMLPRGRGLGGSSAINAMNFIRGHHTSYDAWTSAGAKGWGFDDLLPYFKRSENVVGGDPDLRGLDGPLTVAPANPGNPVVAALLDAAEQTGYRRATDISGGLEEGFGWSDLNVVGGIRQDAFAAYLSPVIERTNLDVVTNALVHRLRIEHGRCTGIDYSVAGELVSVACTGEVVLTAGTIGSAQLLMLSGIGPAGQLRRVGVDVQLDLPGVGENMHDHPIANVVYRAARPVPAARFNHGEAIGLLRSGPWVTAPDLQFVFLDAPGHIPSADAPEQGYTIGVSAITPRSRGTVRLAGAEPGRAPLIDPNYVADDHDMATMVAGLRLAREIGRAPALDPWRDAEVVPCLDDDEGLRSYVRQTLASYSHPVGTCRIGVDATSVVDLELRVHGIEGLRVADGSVIPAIPSANTNATVYAIAERAADLILHSSHSH